MNLRYLTSESVSEGHPDKIADQISDAILDAIIDKDPHARVACESLVKTGLVLVAGEITTHAWVDMETIIRKVIQDIGYNDPSLGFDSESCAVLTSIGKQSSDIAQGVNLSPEKIGAGDQGIAIGFACDETDVLMPATITYAHRLMKRQSKLRKSGTLPWLRPDAKSQVTLRYENNVPVAADSIVLSTQHHPDIDQADLIEAVVEEIIRPVLPQEWLKDTRFYINPTGRFVIGGPKGDCGLTGRKVMVDTYGCIAHHGGGAFSGKDPSKIDRSAAYMARYVAKNIVAAGLAKRCEVQISYSIGVAEPTSVYIETFGTGQMNDADLAAWIKKNVDLTPYGIIQQLQLLRPIYLLTTCYGHFGRPEPEFIWEKIDMAEKFRAALGEKQAAL